MAVLEIARFRLKDDVADQTFLEAEQRIRNGHIRQQPGFIKRETGKSDSGEWTVVLQWESKADADAWRPKFMQDPDGQAFAKLLDLSSMRQDHYMIVTV